MNKSLLMKTVPLLERLERYLEAFPKAQYIPVHPSDYAEARVLVKLGGLARQDLDIVKLGKIGEYKAELEGSAS